MLNTGLNEYFPFSKRIHYTTVLVILSKKMTDTSKELVDRLEKALYQFTYGFTDNQQGMPDHYRGVAAELRQIIKEIENYERWALEEVKTWERPLVG